MVAPQTAVTDPQRLINLLQSEAITLMQATPATWQMLVGADWQGQPGLRMITGGEVLTVTLAKQLLARGDKLWNMYAPSETTTYSTIQPVLAADIADADAIPIGRPLANTQLYILDEQLNQVPIGVTGELYIGGEGVAPGYLNQPALTAERFVENPFPGEPSARLYRTGDVVSFRADGAVNFFGRADHQVKIRGFRIELGEIESRLRQHPAVSQAVVKPHQQQLVAYLIFEDESEVASGDLRRFVQESLPAYMVPYLFMPLAQFPLTPNGKVDRQALPDPSGERDTNTEYVAPAPKLSKQWQKSGKICSRWLRLASMTISLNSAAILCSPLSWHHGFKKNLMSN
ncbi:MAG: AMP-binding protein [Chloroflexi bacterium]|nr:AMP-binding protein [Chloroflexota bacterium]